MNNSSKLSLFLISLIIISSFSPIVISLFDEKQEYQVKQQLAEVIYLEFQNNKLVTKCTKEIPVNNALYFNELLKTLKSEKNIDDIFNELEFEIVEEQISSEYNFIFKDQTVKGINLKSFNKRLADNRIFNFFCELDFNLVGFGFVMGTHASPIPLPLGIDIFGLFAGYGTVNANGFIPNQQISGATIGGFIGFTGSILFTIIPFFPGPIIIGDGFSIFTIWT